MASFNNQEQKIAKYLSKNPRLKGIIKRLYQFISYLLYKKNEKFICIYPIFKLGRLNNESFFGYYDKSPRSKCGEFTVFHESICKTKNKPSSSIPINIVLHEKSTNKYLKIGESQAYNWQQGSRVYWLDDESLVYNFYDDQKKIYRSKFFSTKTRESYSINSPLYDCFGKEYGLSLNFTRLNALRPDYGYRCTPSECSLENLDGDGLYKTDFKSEKTQLLISLRQLVNLSQKESMLDAKHKVNHIMISPDGKKFIFMHRWISKSGRRFDRLLVANSSGKELKILVDDEMVSHCCWYGNDKIVGYFNYTSNGNAFYKISLSTFEVTLLSEKLLHLGDGHPSIYKNKLLIDSYPNKSRMKKLYVFDISNNTLTCIGEFYESLRYDGETRCDLHPRWSSDGEGIFIDSVHDGSRGLYYIKYSGS